VIRRVVAVLATIFAVGVISGPPAGAIGPPEVDAQATPPRVNPGPPQPMAQRGACVSTGVLRGTDPRAVSPNQLSLKLPEVWQHSRGTARSSP
jgi:membrane-anchored mycosin MYCP